MKPGDGEWLRAESSRALFRYRRARNSCRALFLLLVCSPYRQNPFIAIAAPMRKSDEGAMAASRDRLSFKFFRLVEGEAEGRFAISALLALVLAALIVSLILKGAVP